MELHGEVSIAVEAIDRAGELSRLARGRLVRVASGLLEADDSEIRFRQSLDAMCARRVWPIWEAAFIDERWPVDFATSAIAGRCKNRASELGELKTHLDSKFSLSDANFPAIYAGFAYWAIARDAIAPPSQVAAELTEADIDPLDWEPCFFASVAEAGGATWENVGSPDRRRAFWKWYATNAIPAALAEAAVEPPH